MINLARKSTLARLSVEHNSAIMAAVLFIRKRKAEARQAGDPDDGEHDRLINALVACLDQPNL